MPSRLHEVLVEMFRDRPALAADLLGGLLGIYVPGFQSAQLSAADLNDVAPTEYRADAVVTFDEDGRRVLAVVVEVQLRPDPRKRHTWPAYVATLHARLCCPVLLLVVCPNQSVAEWCRAPIVIGQPGLILNPIVLGPAQIPLITDIEAARRSPELTVMSAMAHGGQSDPAPIFEALLAALAVVDDDHADLYTNVVITALPAAARHRLEEFMSTTTHRYQSVYARRYFDQGEARGEAKALLAVLDARGIDVPDDVRAGIAECTDLDMLERWIRRAATAKTIDDLDDPSADEL